MGVNVCSVLCKIMGRVFCCLDLHPLITIGGAIWHVEHFNERPLSFNERERMMSSALLQSLLFVDRH